jgi:hypothetical protein
MPAVIAFASAEFGHFRSGAQHAPFVGHGIHPSPRPLSRYDPPLTESFPKLL